jgi:trimethylamine:corrinoid methyltransferase-like protein
LTNPKKAYNMCDVIQIILHNSKISYEKKRIKRVGPRGSYLGDEHTIKGLRAGEIIDLNLPERECKRKVWEDSGKETIESRARRKGLELVKNHIVPKLPDDVLKELNRIVEHADETLAG